MPQTFLGVLRIHGVEFSLVLQIVISHLSALNLEAISGPMKFVMAAFWCFLVAQVIVKRVA